MAHAGGFDPAFDAAATPSSPAATPGGDRRGVDDDDDEIGGFGTRRDEAPSSSKPSDRAHWNGSTEFILAAVGAAVGLGNLLRFPYMVFKHGGAPFLIPYALAALFVGVPVLGAELMLGHAMQKGIVDSFAIMHARAWGIGAAATLGGFLLASYYGVIIAWVWVFLLASMTSSLPYDDGKEETFFYDDVLARRDDISRGIGPCKWWLVIALTLTWATCYACIRSGVKSAGKVIWVTLPLPYLLLFFLLVKGFTLDGAGAGLEFYLFKWDWSSLGKGEAWVDAVAQIFFGLSIACGNMPAYGSGCARDNKIGRNAWVIAVANAATSLYAGFVVFTFLGHLAHVDGVSVNDVAQGGWGLAFVVYPAAIATFGDGAAQFFAFCFFLMLLCLAIDSLFALIDGVITAFCDRFPRCAKHRELTAAVACVAGFFAGLPMTTEGGYQVVDVVDAYVSRYALVIAGLAETIFLGWVYGADRLQDESKALCGVGVGGRYFAPTLKYVVPSVLIVMLAYNLTREGETYGGYPRYAIGIFGWLCCVVAQVTLIGLGVAKPFSLLRPGAYLDLEDEEERAGGGGGVAGEGSLEMGRVRSRD